MPILDWHDKESTLKTAAGVPYRLLRHDPALSAGVNDMGNMLVQGDNLEALKALLPYYGGKVKCIFIDPPYNTGSAFEHYDDNLEHAQWLDMMYPRLELLRKFLREDGSIWVTIDDHQAHYLKVIMDEVFGRKNFVANCVWQKRRSRENRAPIGSSHDHVFVYSKLPPREWKKYRNKLPSNSVFRNVDNDPRGEWKPIPFTAQGFRTNQMYPIVSPSGKIHTPSTGRCWGATEKKFQELLEEGRVYFGKDGSSQPIIKKYSFEDDGLVPMTFFSSEVFGDTTQSKREILALFEEEDPFSTPKPERLIQRILHIASNPGDVVLDSFLGSGTTAAVAHKMGRAYIGIEMGDHAQTHCAARLHKVIAGEAGGISKDVGWSGGGGVDFYHLGNAAFDDAGHIQAGIAFADLAAHIWFSETRLGLALDHQSPLLGVHDGIGYYLLYNGILGDKRPQGGNVLTRKILDSLPAHEGQKIIYGESSRFAKPSLERLGITFKQTPYDLKVK